MSNVGVNFTLATSCLSGASKTVICSEQACNSSGGFLVETSRTPMPISLFGLPSLPSVQPCSSQPWFLVVFSPCLGDTLVASKGSFSPVESLLSPVESLVDPEQPVKQIRNAARVIFNEVDCRPRPCLERNALATRI